MLLRAYRYPICSESNHNTEEKLRTHERPKHQVEGDVVVEAELLSRCRDTPIKCELWIIIVCSPDGPHGVRTDPVCHEVGVTMHRLPKQALKGIYLGGVVTSIGEADLGNLRDLG
jgi:hypothetical protein